MCRAKVYADNHVLAENGDEICGEHRSIAVWGRQGEHRQALEYTTVARPTSKHETTESLRTDETTRFDGDWRPANEANMASEIGG